MTLADRAVEIAMRQIGRGEVGGNNQGPWVREYLRSDVQQPWCAGFTSYCFELAWAQHNGYDKWLDAPLAVRKACPLKRSHGARRLYNSLPHRPLGLPKVGDIACWSRGAAGSGLGHVGIVVKVGPENLFHTVEGNRGAYPSKVREYRHELGEGGLLGFAYVVAPASVLSPRGG